MRIERIANNEIDKTFIKTEQDDQGMHRALEGNPVVLLRHNALE